MSNNQFDRGYTFDDVNVWGYRWVNLMRSIKTISNQAEAGLNAEKTAALPEDQLEESAADELIEVEEEEVEIANDEVVEGSGLDFDDGGRNFEAVETRSSEADLVSPEKFDEIENKQAQVLVNLITNLSRFVDIDLGQLIASLTAPHWQPTADQVRPPIDLIRSLTRNAGIDLEIIAKAINQREREQGNPTFQARTLVQADSLASQALAPFQPFISADKHVNIISYFSTNMHIRKIPYDDQVLLLGLPYDSVSLWDAKKGYAELTNFDQSVLDGYTARLPYDYMAIPHEIGHYLYHFGEMPQVAIGTFFGSRHKVSNTYTGWLEELFADTVGCFIAGPLAVLGIQSMLAGIYEQEMFLDDGHHPVPALRPFIMSQILRRLNALSEPHSYKDVPDLLDKNWENHLRQIGILSADNDLANHTFKFRLHANHDDTLPAHLHNNPYAKYFAPKQKTSQFIKQRKGVKIKTTLAQLQSEVTQIVDRYITILLNKADLSGFEPWSKDIQPAHTLQGYDLIMQELLTAGLEQTLIPQEVREDTPVKERTVHIDQGLAEGRARQLLLAWGDSGPSGGGSRLGS